MAAGVCVRDAVSVFRSRCFTLVAEANSEHIISAFRWYFDSPGRESGRGASKLAFEFTVDAPASHTLRMLSKDPWSTVVFRCTNFFAQSQAQSRAELRKLKLKTAGTGAGSIKEVEYDDDQQQELLVYITATPVRLAAGAAAAPDAQSVAPVMHYRVYCVAARRYWLQNLVMRMGMMRLLSQQLDVLIDVDELLYTRISATGQEVPVSATPQVMEFFRVLGERDWLYHFYSARRSSAQVRDQIVQLKAAFARNGIKLYAKTTNTTTAHSHHRDAHLLRCVLCAVQSGYF